MGQTDYAGVTRAQLIARLEKAERARADAEARNLRNPSREELLVELRHHEYELEQQNRALREKDHQLEVSRDLYVSLYELAPVAYCTFDRDGNVLGINQRGVQMLGRDRSLLLGRPFAATAELSDPHVFFEHIRRALQSNKVIIDEVTLAGPRGPLIFQLASHGICDPEGGPTVCRTAFLDLTDRNRAEEQRAALAVEKALRSRFERIDRASAAVSRALVRLSEAGLVGFLKVVVEQARAVAAADYAALGIGGEGGKKFDPWVYGGLSPEQADQIGRTPRGVGVLGAVVEKGRAIRHQDVEEHASFLGFPAYHPTMGAFLGVPINYMGQSRGNLYLANRTGRPGFTEEDQIVVSMLADRVGVALELARLRQLETRKRPTATRSPRKGHRDVRRPA
jgi:PAS domain S-box-containing protein